MDRIVAKASRNYWMCATLAIAVSGLSGCVEPAPPSQAQVALQGSCDDGNMDSCKAILNAQTQRSMAPPPPMPVWQGGNVDAGPFLNRPTQPTPIRCMSGAIVYYPNLCPF